MPTIDLVSLSGSDAVIYVALIVIAIQIVYLGLKLFHTDEQYGELTWERVIAAMIPVKVSEKIYDGFVVLLVVVDITRLILAKEGLPVSALLFATVLVLVIVTLSLERYKAGTEDDEIEVLRRRVAELEAQLSLSHSKEQ